MIPRVRAYFDSRELMALFAGEDAPVRFEQAFAALVGRQAGILFPYARTGFVALLEVFGVRGRAVVLPAYTCVVMAHAAVSAGSRPVFADAAADSFNSNWEELASRITRETGVLVPTHLFGTMLPTTASTETLARLATVPIIHDRTMALGCPWQPQPELRGIADCFGLSLSKTMCMVKGGMVTVDDAKLAAELRAWRDRRLAPATARERLHRLLFFLTHYMLFMPWSYGVLSWLATRIQPLDDALRYYHPCRIDLPEDAYVQPAHWQAAIGLVQLDKLPAIFQRRRYWAERLAAACDGLQTLHAYHPASDSVPTHSIVFADQREAFISAMRQRGIDIGRHFDYCIPDLPAYRQTCGSGEFPNARRLAATVCNLPLYPGLTEGHLAGITAALRAVDRQLAERT